MMINISIYLINFYSAFIKSHYLIDQVSIEGAKQLRLKDDLLKITVGLAVSGKPVGL